MPKPGTVNNPKGRPRGSRNRATKDLRMFIKSFLEKNISTLERDFKKLTPKDRLNLLEKLLKYAIPVQNQTSIDFSQLSEGDIDMIISHLKIDDEAATK